MMVSRSVLAGLLLLGSALLSQGRDTRSLREDPLPDIHDNEVLHDAEVIGRSLVSDVISKTTDSPNSSLGTSTTTTPSPSGSTQGDKGSSSTSTSTTSSTTTAAATSSTTETPAAKPAPLGGFSRFLSDLIQIPIAVMRSVGALLTTTFQTHTATTSSSTSTQQPAVTVSTPVA